MQISKDVNPFVIILSALFSTGRCADILLISNCFSHSHSLWYNKLATLLVNSGHQVVLLDTDPLRAKVGNITHFLIEDVYNLSGMDITPESVEDYSELSTESSLGNLDTYFFYTKLCRKFISSKGVRSLMDRYRGKTFDLIITDYYCFSFLGLVPYFGSPPYIMATAFADPEMVLETVGLYDNPSYVPVRMFSSFPTDMDYYQRLTNTMYSLYFFYKFKTDYMAYEDESAKQIFGKDSPSISEVSRNVSLVMVNTHYSIFGAKPLPPAVIPVAGFHIDSPKSLPEDINSFMNGAKDGVILFSFGTNLTPDVISPKKIRIYLEVFSSVPQRVVWKFNESLVDKIPPNVLIREWIPQTDILAHKNTVAFLSHGGLLGTQEAMHYGVPIIGVPFGVDQLSNVDKIVHNGQGVKLSFKYITADTLKKAILTVTNNKSYKRSMEKLSTVLKDNPMKPKETVKFWIEYVLRNRDSLNYIRSRAVDLPFYQLFLLDVFSLVLLIVSIISVVIVYSVKVIIKLIFYSSSKTKMKTQ